MGELTRRGFLKGSVLAGAAVALGRLPSLPAPVAVMPVAPVVATTFTNTAAVPIVRKIATWVPVTDEVLQDSASMRTYVSDRLRFMVDREMDSEMVA